MIAGLQLIVSAYIAAVLTVVGFVVLRDSVRHVPYRVDMLKLLSGVFVRSGRGPVFAAAKNKKHQQAAENGDQQDLPHDLMVQLGADS